MPVHDEQLLTQVREHIAQLPSYGYRRACALVNRSRESAGLPRLNPKWNIPRDGQQWLAAAQGAPAQAIEPVA